MLILRTKVLWIKLWTTWWAVGIADECLLSVIFKSLVYPSLSMNNFPHVDIELPAVNTAPCKLLFQSTNLFVCLLLIMFFFLSSQIHCFKSFCLLFMTLGLIFNIRDVYSSSNNGTFFLLIQYKLAFSACISCFF